MYSIVLHWLTLTVQPTEMLVKLLLRSETMSCMGPCGTLSVSDLVKIIIDVFLANNYLVLSDL